MNRTWLTLIIVGILFLGVTVFWELYQNLSGAKSNVDVTVIEYQRGTLLTPVTEKHLTSDSKYISEFANLVE